VFIGNIHIVIIGGICILLSAVLRPIFLKLLSIS